MKTTLVRNLPVAATQDGRHILYLELDPQGSLRAWWEGRLAMEVLNVAVDIPSMGDDARSPGDYQ